MTGRSSEIIQIEKLSKPKALGFITFFIFIAVFFSITQYFIGYGVLKAYQAKVGLISYGRLAFIFFGCVIFSASGAPIMYLQQFKGVATTRRLLRLPKFGFWMIIAGVFASILSNIYLGSYHLPKQGYVTCNLEGASSKIYFKSWAHESVGCEAWEGELKDIRYLRKTDIKILNGEENPGK